MNTCGLIDCHNNGPCKGKYWDKTTGKIFSMENSEYCCVNDEFYGKQIDSLFIMAWNRGNHYFDNMPIWTYCPFCGKKRDTEEKQNPQDKS